MKLHAYITDRKIINYVNPNVINLTVELPPFGKGGLGFYTTWQNPPIPL